MRYRIAIAIFITGNMSGCKVWLDNYTGQYYAGGQIQGKVILNFNSETKLRALKVRIVCHEHTEFMGTESYHDSESNERRSRDTLFRGDNDAFSTELILYGGPSSTTSLPVGQHIYPFNITLPNNLAGTFNCEKGCINYQLKAIVDRPMAMDYEDQAIFVVVAPIDLNNLRRPELLEPTSYSEDKTVCCLCCADGPISLDVELPKRTLIPGDTVNVMARLSNMSSTNIQNVELLLKQIITCRVEDPSREEQTIDNTLVAITEVGLGAHGEHTYTLPVVLPMNFTIPNFSLCKLFNVEYRCMVTAKLPGVHSNLEVNMYPEIGNIDIGSGTNQPSGYQVAASGNGQGYPPYSNAGQYPPAPGAGYPPYPPAGGDQYKPPMGFNAPPGGVSVYPPSAPTAPPSGAFTKSQEAEGFSSGQPYPNQLPPSYDSVQYPQ
ncbi:hypothetical protein JTB14_014258 [Gonioctena quinquepunctata]|nr:hypothetical protein JTB14_014258 [Gonioctena quinquepunctata]